MFTEWLKIRLKLDEKDAKEMEKKLNSRFKKVTKTFGNGLKNAMKGNLLFMSLGLIANLLNPLKEVEERIKALLGQGTDIKEIADKFDSSPGKIQRLTDVANNLGVSPDKLYGMMDSFAGAVDKARQEQKKGETLSSSSQLVKEWIGESDMAEAFFSFVQSLQRAKGTDIRDKAEREILGGVQKGSSQRFIDANFEKEFKGLGTPGIDRTNKAIEKVAQLAEQDRRLTTRRETGDLVKSAELLNPEMIKRMNAGADRETEKERNQLKAFNDLAKASEGIAELTGILNSVKDLATKGVGYLGELVGYIKNSRFVKYFTGGK